MKRHPDNDLLSAAFLEQTKTYMDLAEAQRHSQLKVSDLEGALIHRADVVSGKPYYREDENNLLDTQNYNLAYNIGRVLLLRNQITSLENDIVSTFGSHLIQVKSPKNSGVITRHIEPVRGHKIQVIDESSNPHPGKATGVLVGLDAVNNEFTLRTTLASHPLDYWSRITWVIKMNNLKCQKKKSTDASSAKRTPPMNISFGIPRFNSLRTITSAPGK